MQNAEGWGVFRPPHRTIERTTAHANSPLPVVEPREGPPGVGVLSHGATAVGGTTAAF